MKIKIVFFLGLILLIINSCNLEFNQNLDVLEDTEQSISLVQIESEITHRGDLIINGTETFLIEDESYLQQGNIYINDKAKLDIWRSNQKGIQYKDKTSGILLRGAVDNLLEKGEKLVVLDYKTRGYPLKEDTHEHYQTQMDIYNFLLRMNGYDTENYAYLLFYYPREIAETGEVIFDTKLIKIPTNVKSGESVFKEAIKILNLKEPPKASQDCGFCKWNTETSRL